MIVCATPRCGGTIFSINKAAELGIPFEGELSVKYVKHLGLYGTRKERHHETRFQPTYSLQDYLARLKDSGSPDRLFLVNENVSLALALSSFRIATRDVMRAFRSMADLIIRSTPEFDPDAQLELIAKFCREQLETNLLLTHYCRLTGEPLEFFEDLFTPKGHYPHLDGFAHRRRLEKYLSHLKTLDVMHG